MVQIGHRSTCLVAIYTDKCPNHPDSLVGFYDSGQLNGPRESMIFECMSERGNFPTVLDFVTVDFIEGQTLKITGDSTPGA